GPWDLNRKGREPERSRVPPQDRFQVGVYLLMSVAVPGAMSHTLQQVKFRGRDQTGQLFPILRRRLHVLGESDDMDRNANRGAPVTLVELQRSTPLRNERGLVLT